MAWIARRAYLCYKVLLHGLFELQCIEKKIQIAIEHHYLNLTVEWDSNFIIIVLNNLLNETPTTIVIKN